MKAARSIFLSLLIFVSFSSSVHASIFDDYFLASEMPVSSGGIFTYGYQAFTPVDGLPVNSIGMALQPGLTLQNFNMPVGWSQSYNSTTGSLIIDTSLNPVISTDISRFSFDSPSLPGQSAYTLINNPPVGAGVAITPLGAAVGPVWLDVGGPPWAAGGGPVVRNTVTFAAGSAAVTAEWGGIYASTHGFNVRISGKQTSTAIQNAGGLWDYRWTFENTTVSAARGIWGGIAFNNSADAGFHPANGPFHLQVHAWAGPNPPLNSFNNQLPVAPDGGLMSFTLLNQGPPILSRFSTGYNPDINNLESLMPVPEPETYAMMLAGLGLLGFVAHRRKQPVTGNA